MLTRIRIESHGATITAVQEDIFATYDALCEVVYGPLVVPAFKLVDEHVRSATPPDGFHVRWYKGNATVVFPADIDTPFKIDAARLRPRIEWLAEQDRQFEERSGANSPGTEHEGLERTPMRGDAWREFADMLAEALRLTQEYVGDGLLPALPGWSWFDALTAYAQATGNPPPEQAVQDDALSRAPVPIRDDAIMRVDFERTGRREGSRGDGVIRLVNTREEVVAQHTGSRDAAEALASALNVTWTHFGPPEGEVTPQPDVT